MKSNALSRRDCLAAGSAAFAVALVKMASPGFVFAGEADDETPVPFLNMPRTAPQRLDWESLDSWITPQDQVFHVQHYNIPSIDPKTYKLQITGLVDRPASLGLEEIGKLPQEDRLMTLECSGNGASKGFMNAVYNSKWSGTPLAAVLKSCGIKPEAKEVVFFGADEKEDDIRKGLKLKVPFGRSMSIEEAMNPYCLLATQRGGKPLVQGNGAPLRLIVPGWYGIANVKWLTRIELRDARYMGRFMARDYVTVRGERQGDEIVYVESSVSRMNLKSVIARVTRRAAAGGMIPAKAYGAVWSDGTPIQKVDVQVDGGDWQQATLDKDLGNSKFCWTFFSIDLGNLKAGKHTLVSRATDENGRVQPAATDDEIALKKTYWEAYQQWPREIEL